VVSITQGELANMLPVLQKLWKSKGGTFLDELRQNLVTPANEGEHVDPVAIFNAIARSIWDRARLR